MNLNFFFSYFIYLLSQECILHRNVIWNMNNEYIWEPQTQNQLKHFVYLKCYKKIPNVKTEQRILNAKIKHLHLSELRRDIVCVCNVIQMAHNTLFISYLIAGFEALIFIDSKHDQCSMNFAYAECRWKLRMLLWDFSYYYYY